MLGTDLIRAFQSVMGPVETADIWNSLWLMLQGMAGIFVVMALIFIVILVLGAVNKRKKAVQDDDENNTSSR